MRLFARRLLLALWVALPGAPALAATPPACGGVSLAEELKAQAPDRLAAALARGAAIRNGEGLLWRVETPGVAASHLFGTMHLTDARAAELPPPVRDVLAGARSVAVELTEAMDPQGAAQLGQKLVQAAVDLSRDTLAFLADPPARREVEAILGEYGVAAEMAQRLRPWFLALMVAMPTCELARQGAGLPSVDKQVASGRPPGAALVGLETPDEQVALLASMDEAIALLSLSTAPRYKDQRENIVATLVDLYLQRRMGALREVFVESDVLEPKDVDAYTAMETWLRIERDPRMAERSLPLLRQGGAFIAVGALHLPGEDGLVERFRRAGYTVTRVW